VPKLSGEHIDDTDQQSTGTAHFGRCLGAPAAAYDGLVEKNVFELPSYTTVGGQPIAPVRIGADITVEGC